MKFIQKMKNSILFVQSINKIKFNYEKIKKSNDYQDEKLYSNILNTLPIVHKLLNSEDFIMQESEVAQKIKKDLHFLEYEIEYIQKFLQKNWQACLNLGMEVEKSNVSNHLFLAYNIILESIVQLKNEIPEKSYNELYKWIEVDYENKAHQYMVLEQFQQNQEVVPKKFLKVQYSGIYMNLAYLAYLNHDDQKMMNYIERQKELFSLEEILHNENIESQPWYYGNIHPNYLDFLNITLLKDLEIKKEKTLKM